jgi:hypothetical protein
MFGVICPEIWPISQAMLTLHCFLLPFSVSTFTSTLAPEIIEKVIINFRKASPPAESAVLCIDHLSRNVNEAHLKEIFGELTYMRFILLEVQCYF